MRVIPSSTSRYTDILFAERLAAGLNFVALNEVHLEPLRGEVEAYGDDAEQAKGGKLENDTGHSQVLAQLNLLHGVRVYRVCRCTYDPANQLEEEGDDIEGDEDGCDPSRCGWAVSQYSYSLYPTREAYQVPTEV